MTIIVSTYFIYRVLSLALNFVLKLWPYSFLKYRKYTTCQHLNIKKISTSTFTVIGLHIFQNTSPHKYQSTQLQIFHFFLPQSMKNFQLVNKKILIYKTKDTFSLT